ncbi:hypothetical protein BAS06_07020 [Elizabethkingia miricola]|uniref:hypothetical protein n=1 Tax=Weeksellaceae TaxID=2762318 RepID=UPI0009999E5C|nr:MULTISPECIES: hypothetical protein [Weeksellaceae]MDV3492440.1 hypothetical protein [Elizabethkingia anophelis]MDV4129680.1 hypothetical protein [Elizabethkingia anophelis]MDV4133368.1 hypothetical protein [Elizabethkingia anophelis]OPB90084.1 hypothetical protein BAS06_07020 [Elizabethkingia miricola]OPC56091.1 hypothetical protein BAY08_04880 [Elizabethkingia anophelis]
MKVNIRLEFNHIYPESEKEEVIEYLKRLSKKTIENIIGFFTTDNLPDYYNFFSNPATQQAINQLVAQYIFDNKILGNITLISREAALFLSETILSNKEILIINNTKEENPNEEELNLFKVFLVINEGINRNDNLTLDITQDNIERIAEISIALKFSTADIGVYEDVNIELLKLGYVTSYKFEKLVDFLKSKEEYKYLIEDLCQYFNQNNLGELSAHVDFLLVQVLRFKNNNSFKLRVEDEESKKFLQSLTSGEIIAETDFLKLRNHPLYQIDEFTYSIVDPFFVLDKFTKSVKFILKESFNKKNNLNERDRTFFNFYNKEFSEEYLMKKLLDNIFFKKYYIKQNGSLSQDKEPDYYYRYNNDIFVFEYKDVLIAKEVKTSGDIGQITDALKKKFLINPTNRKPIGIGQLINHIKAISENEFVYDESINLNKRHKIYPILLLSDRLLEIPGVNYILNKWLRNNLPVVHENIIVNDLIIIDIDTMIFFTEYLKRKDKYFKDLLDDHTKKMNMPVKGYGNTEREVYQTYNNKISKKLAPFSNRFSNSMFDEKLFINRFSYLIKEDSSN